MQANDYLAFRELMREVASYYRMDMTPFLLSTWWGGLHAYELEAIRHAFELHAESDWGHNTPWVSDVRKLITGSTLDRAQMAWTKVDRTVRTVGPYQSVVFDDALIHCVLSDMGGWTLLATKTEEEWPYVEKEFVTRYRGYAMRSECPDYPPVLPGIAEMHNGAKGHVIAPPVLVGNEELARQVMLLGIHRPRLAVTRLDRKLEAVKS